MLKKPVPLGNGRSSQERRARLEPKGGLEMVEATTHGILLISDISGYTEFVRRHARSASHASIPATTVPTLKTGT